MTGSGGAGSGGDGSGGAGSGGASGTGGVVVPTDAGSGGAVGDAGLEVGGTEAGDAAPLSHPEVLMGAQALMLQGNVTGGSQYQDNCPAGQALIGFSGSVNNTDVAASVNRQITAVCGVIAIDGTTVTIKVGATLTTRGMAGVSAWVRGCAANQVMVGFSGRNGTLVDQLAFSCAPLTVSSAAVGTTLMAGAQTALAAIGGNGGAAFGPINCPAGQIGSGAVVRTGTELDAFGMVCSKAEIAP